MRSRDRAPESAGAEQSVPRRSPDSRTHAKPRQSLGQNFLIDENIVRNIVKNFRPEAGDVVMEIGPGRGALTSHLAGRVKHLIIVEIDGRVIENLRGRFCSPAVTILHQDFLDVDLASWRDLHGSKIRLIGNIPYHLTSPILFKAFEERAAITDLTIMAQREVTRRIVAKPGSKEYGILSVSTWLYGVPEILFSVSPNCFYPKPKVTSSVLTIRLHDRLPEGVDPRVFETVVRTVFGKRRKTLRNGLKYLPYDEAVVERIMEGLTGVLDKRPEQLTPEQFAGLAVHIGKLIA